MRLTLSGHCPTTCAPGSHPQPSAAQAGAPVCKSPRGHSGGRAQQTRVPERRAEGRGHSPHPEGISRVTGGGASSPTLSWGAPGLRDRTSGLRACVDLGTAVTA